MTDLIIDRDREGWPILLGQSKSGPTPKSGEGSTPPQVPSIRPTSVAHDEWTRRQDAVREASREFEDLTAQDLRERLRGVTSKPFTDADLEQFRIDVRAAVLDDLVDVLDQNARGKARGRRTVRVTAPRGYTRKATTSLSDQECEDVRARLLARGLTKQQLDKVLPASPPETKRPDPGAASI